MVTDEQVKQAWASFDGQFFSDRLSPESMFRMRRVLEAYEAAKAGAQGERMNDPEALTASYMLGLHAGKGAGVPDGWKLVPVEPTEDMLNAAQDVNRDQGRQITRHRTLRRRWTAMLAAAPQPPTED